MTMGVVRTRDRPVEASPPVVGPSPKDDLPAPIAHGTSAEDVLVQVSRYGGLAGVHNMLFTLRGDGTVVAPLTDSFSRETGPTREFVIDEDGIQKVLIAARDAGLLAREPIDYGRPGVTDAFQTTVALNAGGRSVTRAVYALGFDFPGFSSAQLAARQALVSFISGLPRGEGSPVSTGSEAMRVD